MLCCNQQPSRSCYKVVYEPNNKVPSWFDTALIPQLLFPWHGWGKGSAAWPLWSVPPGSLYTEQQPASTAALSVSLIARRSSVLGQKKKKPLMWWMDEGHRAALGTPIVFLFSHHSANSNLDRQRQTEARPVNHSPSLESPRTCLATEEVIPLNAFINVFDMPGWKNVTVTYFKVQSNLQQSG